jgi:hypothetical protein
MKPYEYFELVSKERHKKKRPNAQIEDVIKMAFIVTIKREMPEMEKFIIPLDLHAIKLTPPKAAKLKRLGGKKGMADYFICKGNENHLGLFLEFKRPKTPRCPKGVQSKEQKEFETMVIPEGYKYKIVYSVDEALKEIKDYLN